MIPRPKPQKCSATIASKTQLTSNIILVDFALITPPELEFLAGQTLSLNVSPTTNRSMSIASPPSEKRIFSCHDVSPGGLGSLWTINHREGDAATFMAPLGLFVMDRGES